MKDENKNVIVRFPKEKEEVEIYSGEELVVLPKNKTFGLLKKCLRDDKLGYLTNIDITSNNVGFRMESPKEKYANMYISFEDKNDPYCEEFLKLHNESRVKRSDKSIKKLRTYDKVWECVKVGAGVALSIGTIVGIGAIIGETWGREIEMSMEATEEFFRNNPFAQEAAEKMSGMMHR